MPRNCATGCFELTIQTKQKAEKAEKSYATVQQAIQRHMIFHQKTEIPCNCATGIFEDVRYSTKKLRFLATAQRAVSAHYLTKI